MLGEAGALSPPPLDAAELDAYFRRINYSGGRDPTLDTLIAIQTHHTLAISFENASMFLRDGSGAAAERTPPQSLKKDDLMKDLVHSKGANGRCFKQNSMIALVLQSIGFTVERMLSRVRWNVPAGVETGLVHCCLRVRDVDGVKGNDYLVDAAFGSTTSQIPIKMVDGVPQKTPLDWRRLHYLPNGDFVHQIAFNSSPDTWHDLYHVVAGIHPTVSDYEVGAWYCATSPDLFLSSNLICSRPSMTGRTTLENRVLIVRNIDGTKEKRVLEDEAEIIKVLRDVFDLNVPEGSVIDCPGLKTTPNLKMDFIA